MWTSFKKAIFIIGILIIVIGALPLLVQYEITSLPSAVPLSGWQYKAAIIVLGIFLLILARPSRAYSAYPRGY